MAGDTIEIGIKDGIAHVEVQNLISKASKDKSLLVSEPLMLKVSIPAKFLDGADDGAGENRLRRELQKKLLPKLEAEMRRIVAAVQDRANREMAELGARVRKELEKDQKGDAGAYAQAGKLVDEAARELEDLTNGVPVALREAIKKSGLFAAKSLSSVGTWGFPNPERGIRLRPGVFQNADKDDRDNAELGAALKSAKGGGYDFVLVDNGPGGLVVRRSVGSSATAIAKEQAGGRGSALFGRIEHDGDRYKFLLDKSCSDSRCKGLARKIRNIVKERCGKSIKVWVADNDRADDDERETAAAGSAGRAGAKK